MEPNRRFSHPAGSHLAYLWIMGAVFVAFMIVILFFPRTKYSELEKRQLAEFPDLGSYGGKLSSLPSDISVWFSDSEPYRDEFMTLSMTLRDKMGLNIGNPDEIISFKGADVSEQPSAAPGAEGNSAPLEGAGNPLANENAKLSNSGTIVVGAGDNVRALMAFGGTPGFTKGFLGTVGRYAEALPGVNIYVLVAPLATEFYLPDKASSLSKPQKPVLDYIRDNVEPKAKFVDVYSALAPYTNEDIYLRTDHHWAPLGAFYAARSFAKTAGVPFKELDSYEKHTIKRFVGSMYGYTKDIAVKNAPEDFVYYTPKGLDFKAEYVTYKLDADYHIVSASQPYSSSFFKSFKDGSGNAYLTFMGSDQNLVKVTTGTKSPRKLLIIKDSYGNPVPGYLFYSFGEVHVVDFRYFPRNVKDYVKENGITDILFAFNIFNVCNNSAVNKINDFLTKPNGIVPPKPKVNEDHQIEQQVRGEYEAEQTEPDTEESRETSQE